MVGQAAAVSAAETFFGANDSETEIAVRRAQELAEFTEDNYLSNSDFARRQQSIPLSHAGVQDFATVELGDTDFHGTGAPPGTTGSDISVSSSFDFSFANEEDLRGYLQRRNNASFYDEFL